MKFPVHHVALDGLDILTARFGDTGQVSLSVYQPRSSIETATNAGLAALSVRSMMRGTARYTASELAFAMESLGGSVGPSLGADVLGFGTIVLSEHIRRAAELLAEVFYRPRFAEDAIEIERRLLLDDARSVADDMVRFPIQLMLGVAFADTGYGSPSLGTSDSVSSLTAHQVRQWHAEMLSGGRTTVIAVGDADPEELAKMLAGAFGHAERSEAPMRVHEQRPVTIKGPSLRSGRRVESRDRKQSALAMLFPGPARDDPDRFAAETWGAIAAGLGGRMFESLRSKRSLAYTVIANSWQRRTAGGLLTYIATDPARLDEARDAMLDELDVFRREAVSADELSRATAMLAGEAEMSRQTASGYAGEIADAWLLGSGLEELDDPAAPYRSVTAEMIHAVTARALDPAKRAEGVVVAAATE
jgi:zinc protease